ncbi:SPOR domain-containing protein [Candidatus Rariloculus sp.]|uniref:SPOR domain-containing protein n=1 Tax=Candidatus Rariloculus sp. TaxID=3101265 RepID=UPI003D0B6190
MKERLIGAAVLVALGVWLIPWILDGRDQQPETEPVPLLPAQPEESAPLRTQTIDLDRSADTAPAAPETAEPVADRTPSAPPSGATAADNAPPAPETAEAVAANARLPETGQTVAANAPLPPTGETGADGALEAPPAAAVSGTRPPRGPATQTAAAPDTRDEPGGWVVQLGSFSEEENAERLAARVTTYGFEPEVSVFQATGRTMYRVRIGPYEARGGADETASMLVANGFIPVQVVAAD